MNKCSS